VGTDRFKVWVDGGLQINVTDSTHLAGGVAFAADQARFDNVKIGYAERDRECDQGGSVNGSVKDSDDDP